MSGATVDKIRVFQCPQCGEFINTSMSACQFCGAAVNAEASQAAADV